MFTLPYVLAALIALSGGVELSRLDEQIQASKQLKQGDSEARVLDVLGPPRERWHRRSAAAAFVFSARPAQWIYGTNIDLGEIVNPELPFPNLVPIKLRIFSPNEGDLVIVWDDHGAVASVDRPKN